MNFGDYLLDFGAFGIIEIVLMGCIFLFAAKITAKIMRRFAADE